MTTRIPVFSVYAADGGGEWMAVAHRKPIGVAARLAKRCEWRPVIVVRDGETSLDAMLAYTDVWLVQQRLRGNFDSGGASC